MEKILKNLPRKYKRGTIQIFSIVLQAISNKIDDFDNNYLSLIASCSIITAEGFWLNFWGYFYKINRFLGENDTSYRRRILNYVKHGTVNRESIIETAKIHSNIEPILTEHHGQITVNYDYLDYDYDYSNFLMTLTYNPVFISKSDKVFFVGSSYIGHNTYLVGMETRYSFYLVKNILNNLKAAGVKLIHNVVT